MDGGRVDALSKIKNWIIFHSLEKKLWKLICDFSWQRDKYGMRSLRSNTLFCSEIETNSSFLRISNSEHKSKCQDARLICWEKLKTKFIKIRKTKFRWRSVHLIDDFTASRQFVCYSKIQPTAHGFRQVIVDHPETRRKYKQIENFAQITLKEVCFLNSLISISDEEKRWTSFYSNIKSFHVSSWIIQKKNISTEQKMKAHRFKSWD